MLELRFSKTRVMLNVWNASKEFIDSVNNVVRKGLHEVFRRVQAPNLSPIVKDRLKVTMVQRSQFSNSSMRGYSKKSCGESQYANNRMMNRVHAGPFPLTKDMLVHDSFAVACTKIVLI